MYTEEQQEALRALYTLIPPVAETDLALGDDVGILVGQGKLGDAIGLLRREQSRLEREFRTQEVRNAVAAWLVENIASLDSLEPAAEQLHRAADDCLANEIATAEAKAGWDPNP